MAKRAFRKYKRNGDVCPITGHVSKLVKHHIHGKDVPRAEEGWNLCWISPEAHDRIHSGEVIVEGWFMTSEGLKLAWRDGTSKPLLVDGARPPLYKGVGQHGYQTGPEERTAS